MKRLALGLTDAERREQDLRRRERNCLIGLVLCILIVGWITYPA